MRGDGMSPLGEVLQEAGKNRVAIGHFNFSELVVLKAATEAASELGVPVVMGLSESEREFLGVRQAAALAKSLLKNPGLEPSIGAGCHPVRVANLEKMSSSLPHDSSEQKIRTRLFFCLTVVILIDILD